MKVVQTFWSCRNDLLKHSFGWLSPEYHLMSWALSSLKLKEYYEDLHLYADTPTSKIFINILGLPYKEAHILYDDIDEQYKNYYALPKILTYSKQGEPFIHVDGDVFTWRRFSQELEDSELIAQNLEKGTEYYKVKMECLTANLTYLPRFLKEELAKPSIPAYNAGVLGGNDLVFLHEFADMAKTLIRNNRAMPASFNILFEQILFYALSIKKNKTVGCVLKEVIEDFGYSLAKVADFSLVPNKASYLHLIGGKKKDPEICALMSRMLMQEYPDIYFRIIELFPGKHRRFEGRKHISFDRTPILLDKKTKFNQVNKAVVGDSSENLKEVFQFDRNFVDILEKWEKIELDCLLSFQLQPLNMLEPFMESKELQKKTYFQRNPWLEIVEGSFSWTAETKSCINPGLIPADPADTLGLACIPHILFDGYNEVVIDELEYNLLTVLNEQLTVVDIITRLEGSFPETDDDDTDAAKYRLILLKLKRLFLTQCIHFSMTL
jgi:hypothetical protein